MTDRYASVTRIASSFDYIVGESLYLYLVNSDSISISSSRSLLLTHFPASKSETGLTNLLLDCWSALTHFDRSLVVA